MTAEIIGEFIAALTEEIAAVKKKDGSSGIRLSMGELIENANGMFVYKFTSKRDLSVIETWATLQLEINGQRHECTIVATEEKQIKLAIAESVGSRVNLARLIVSQTAMHQMLIDCFTDALTTGSLEQFNFADQVFSGQCQKLCETPDQIRTINQKRESNPSQINAICNSYSNSLAVIWGPPGTGKTKTIARAVEAHLRAGRRVLLVSRRNTALDTALEATAELLHDSFYAKGQLVRVGVPKSTTLCQRFPLVLPKSQIEQQKSERLEQIISLQSRHCVLAKRLAACESVVKLSEQIKKQQETKLESRILHATKAAKSYNAVVAEVYQITCQIEQARQKLQEIDSRDYSRTVFWRTKLQNLTAVQASKQQVADELRIKLNYSLNYNETAQVKEADQQLEQLVTSAGISPNAALNEITDLRKQISTISARILKLEAVEAPYESEILSSARLVAATLAKTFASSVLDGEKFDVLIVDEASMVQMPQLYWALGKTKMTAT